MWSLAPVYLLVGTLLMFHVEDANPFNIRRSYCLAKNVACSRITLGMTITNRVALPTVELLQIGDHSVDQTQKLIYLPGLDGSGNYSYSTLGTLENQYNCWKINILPSDRSKFLELALLVRDYIKKINGGKPITIVGESFGGLLAAYIASRYPQLVSKLILVNPATSFDRTSWKPTAPLLASTGPLFPYIGMATIVATVLDKDQITGLGKNIITRASSNISEIGNLINVVADELRPITQLPNVLPKETLTWRIKEWLDVGNFVVKGSLSKIIAPTLLLIGEDDKMLPSKSEGRRLQNLLNHVPFIRVRNFGNRGHALLDPTFPLMKEIDEFDNKYLKFKTGDLKVELPSADDMQQINKRLGPLINASSTVFFSTGENGAVIPGIGNVPTGLNGRPVLLVGNHQLLGLDLAIIIREFIQKRGVLIRGLAHPMIFSREFGQDMREAYEKFGAVKVSPMTYFKLLRQNETILLFPGGAKEALHKKGEDYKLFWPQNSDFVRMAALNDAIIVPFAAIGMADSAQIIADRDDILGNKIIGPLAKDFADRIPQARSGGDDQMIFPLVAPSLPSRNYILFMKPFETKNINANSKDECNLAYKEIGKQVEIGISSLLKYREQDYYRDFIPRTLKEASTRKQAPYPSSEILQSIIVSTTSRQVQ